VSFSYIQNSRLWSTHWIHMIPLLSCVKTIISSKWFKSAEPSPPYRICHYSCSLISMGNWLQNSLWIPTSMDAQVSDIKWTSCILPMYILLYTFFETGSHCVAQWALNLQSSSVFWVLGLQVWASTPASALYFKSSPDYLWYIIHCLQVILFSWIGHRIWPQHIHLLVSGTW
jgi:endogenous inhibitor of DNA gyrase (YacG/DUF329 family)